MMVDLILIIMIIYLIGFLPSFFSGLSSITIPDIATVVLAFATVVLAYYTYMLYQESKQMRLARIRPEIALYITPQKQWINFINLTIKNIGPGTAYNVKFSVNPEFLYGFRDQNKRLADAPLIKKGLDYMAPNQDYSFLLFSVMDYKGESLPILDMTVFYENVLRENCRKDFHFDFSFFMDLGTESDYIYEISQRLQEIKSTMETISKKLK